jgi:phosphohistidine phosphatase
MTRRLILMRHAKSAWDRPGLRDHDRKLNKRGRDAAPLMAGFIRDEGLVPDLAYVSSAARTQETWSLMALGAPMKIISDIYDAQPEDIIDVVTSAPDLVRTLMILGHQPTMQEAANRFLPHWEVDSYPTAKLAVIGFEAASWADVTFGSGKLLKEAAPKTLTPAPPR